MLEPSDLQIYKKRLQHGCFPVNIANFFKKTYFEEHLQTAAFASCQSQQRIWLASCQSTCWILNVFSKRPREDMELTA